MGKKLGLFIGVMVLGLMGVQAHASHIATVSFVQNTDCVTGSTCNGQIYRAVGQCPATGIGSLPYTRLVSSLVAATVTATGSSWSYDDTTIVDGQTYCYYATVTLTAGGGPSQPSATFQGIVPFSAPVAPSSINVVVH